jgi:hypothetical protein
MKKLVAIIVIGLSVTLLAKPPHNSSSKHHHGGGGSNVISLNPSDWQVLAAGPFHLTANNPGWSFSFPTFPNSINYLYTSFTSSLLAHSMLTFTANVTITSTTPVIFDYMTEPFNTCIAPATARAIVMSTDPFGSSEFSRFWSNPIAFELDDNNGGQLTVITPLTPDEWSDVNGQFNSSGWNATFSNPGYVGLTFGGGCFFGHGVGVLGGSATFSLMNYSVQ